jgi:hypothetical protein
LKPIQNSDDNAGMQFRLRTLLILLAVLPLLLAGAWWLYESQRRRLVYPGPELSGVSWAEAVEATKPVSNGK